MLDKILAFFGIYWYQLDDVKVYAGYLEAARAKLSGHRELIATNDPSIV